MALNFLFFYGGEDSPPPEKAVGPYDFNKGIKYETFPTFGNIPFWELDFHGSQGGGPVLFEYASCSA